MRYLGNDGYRIPSDALSESVNSDVDENGNVNEDERRYPLDIPGSY